MKKVLLTIILIAGIGIRICFGEARFLKATEVDVNTYTATKVSEVSVSGINVYSETISYKVSFDGINYITLPANCTLNLENIKMAECNIYLLGATNSGKVEVIFMKY